MKKGYDCNALLPILCKYDTVVHCHHSQVHFNFYFESRTTYFLSLTDSTVTKVIRFVSKYPRHLAWHRFIESSNSFKLVRTNGSLERAVLNLFDSISSKPLLCFGNGFIDEDTVTWLYLQRNQNFEVVLPHVERLRI